VNDLAAEVVIIGSGPAGVSAAWPLVEAGLKVLMLDQGRAPDLRRNNANPLTTILWQQDDSQWRELLGESLAGLGDDRHSTPKMKVPHFRYVQEGFEEAYRLSADGVRITGALAAGGLSTMWGAGPFCYAGADLAGYPLPAHALELSYNAVARRIGISGVSDDDLGEFLGEVPLEAPLPLHENAARLLAGYRRKRSALGRFGLTLGRTRNAVLTSPRPGRGACTLDKTCLWGCPHGAIYSAQHDLEALTRKPNFEWRRGFFVQRIAPLAAGGYALHGRDLDRANGGELKQTATRVLLAAGTIGSGILALDALGLHGAPQPILLHPAMRFAFVLPPRIAAPEEKLGFALGQLAYRIDFADDPQDYAFGITASAEGLLASEIAQYMPLSRPAAAAAVRALLPAMLVANCYLGSDHAKGSITSWREGDLRSATVHGRVLPTFDARFAQVKQALARGFRQLGAWLLPGGATRAELGSDGHYVGTIPMTTQERPLSSTPDGEVRGLPGLFAVDGASLPRLPGKHPTFTIMANADRIARGLLNRGRA
jgi:choline dehydrogenase-like flavoprotein